MTATTDRLPVLDRRRAGVLLHPTALPGDHGVLGAAARGFIDWLAAAGFEVWQVLPLGPVGSDASPYWVRSDCALNTALTDARETVAIEADLQDFERFCAGEQSWLEDHVLFEALSAEYSAPWWEWPMALRDRDTRALRMARRRHAVALHTGRRAQWLALRQWQALRSYAHDKGVRLFGDLPIYVAPDSASVWAQREQFQLAADGRALAVAGVPPDYFSADGQLWGNPLYDWAQAQRDGFAFWRTRLACQLQRFDLVRIDHFRGLAGYWSVPAGARTARDGQWVTAPGHALLQALHVDYADLPLVAEDLGVITPDVDELRHAFRLPGMRVVQFGFDGSPANPHLPHNFVPATVAYTGTHDNDTALGWYRSLPHEVAHRVDEYLGSNDQPRALWRGALASVAQLAIAPMQDLLGLGSEARFNVPGTVGGNWQWRMHAHALHEGLAPSLRHLNLIFGRLNA